MSRRFQFAGCLLALGLFGALALTCAAAQRPRANYAHQGPTPRQQAKQQRQAQRQQQRAQKPQRTGAGRSAPGNEGNPNRPPAARNQQQPPKRFENLTPQEKQRVLENNRKLQNLPPVQRQEMRERAQVWQHMTPEQQNHIRNEVLPRWKQMPPERRQVVQRKLQQLKNMPESARNQRLNDPEFTRGMSDEDKGTLRDLSHLHVGGAPDPPGE